MAKEETTTLHKVCLYGTMREHMAKECAITKKTSQVGGKYANRTRATVFTPTGSHRKYANLQKKRVYVPEIDKTLTITVSTKGMRTIQKNGAYNALKTAGVLK